MSQTLVHENGVTYSDAGTPLFFEAGKVKIGLRHERKRPEVEMTRAELDAQGILLGHWRPQPGRFSRFMSRLFS